MPSEQVPTDYSVLAADPSQLRGWVNQIANGDALANFVPAIHVLRACADKITGLQVCLGKEKQALEQLSAKNKELNEAIRGGIEALEAYQAQLREAHAELVDYRRLKQVAWALACELSYPVVKRICDRYDVTLTNLEESDA